MWEDFIHHIYDIFYILQWLIDSLQGVFSIVFMPLSWVFNLGRGFLVGVLTTPEEIEFSFPMSAISFFEVIPYFSLIFLATGGILGILFISFVFRKISDF